MRQERSSQGHKGRPDRTGSSSNRGARQPQATSRASQRGGEDKRKQRSIRKKTEGQTVRKCRAEEEASE